MKKNLARILAMAAGLGFAAASSGVTAATECNGPLSGTVTGGVVVKAGDFCMLKGAIVDGGVRIHQGGILLACGSTINGGLVAYRASNVLVGPEEVPGCAGNIIRGGVWIFNTGPGVLMGPPSIGIENNNIKGGMFLIGNQGQRIAVASNMIKGVLFCKNNVASVLDDEGHGNIITGPTNCAFGK